MEGRGWGGVEGRVEGGRGWGGGRGWDGVEGMRKRERQTYWKRDEIERERRN